MIYNLDNTLSKKDAFIFIFHLKAISRSEN
jgi:hypothetical protein